MKTAKVLGIAQKASKKTANAVIDALEVVGEETLKGAAFVATFTTAGVTLSALAGNTFRTTAVVGMHWAVCATTGVVLGGLTARGLNLLAKKAQVAKLAGQVVVA